MTRYRSAGALGCHTRIREGFPRDLSARKRMARDRPSHYGKRDQEVSPTRKQDREKAPTREETESLW